MKAEKFIGLAGLGCWGKNILRNLYDLCVLHTACDISPDIISACKEKLPDVSYSALFDEVINNPEIKAIVIATPAATHYEYAKKALLAGKDVYVEKPLALTVAEGEEIVHIADREKKILMVGHILRYHPAVVKLDELVTSGSIGKIQYRRIRLFNGYPQHIVVTLL